MSNRNIPLRVVRAVREQYASPNRFYHGLNHLDHLMSVHSKLFASYNPYDVMNNEAYDLTTAEYANDLTVLAILFHDAIYNVWNGSPENENDSAHHLEYVYGDVLIKEGGWAADDLEIVGEMIRTTARHNLNNSHKPFLEKLLLDIDISNFAESLDVCKYNQEQIYKEFQPRFPDKDQFLAGNVSFLQSLLDRPTLYYTPMFADKEAKARENIEAMIKGA